MARSSLFHADAPFQSVNYNASVSSIDLSTRISSDQFRYAGEVGFFGFLKTWRYEPGFRISLLLRLAEWSSQTGILKPVLLRPISFLLGRKCIRYGVHLSGACRIGAGLYLPHPLGIVIHGDCIIGQNCVVSQNVTLGETKRGARKGTPVIGNRVYIAPGAVVIGGIHIGDDVAIGANCVVTRDVPPNSVVAGVPGKVLSENGSHEYITNAFPFPDDDVT